MDPLFVGNPTNIGFRVDVGIWKKWNKNLWVTWTGQKKRWWSCPLPSLLFFVGNCYRCVLLVWESETFMLQEFFPIQKLEDFPHQKGRLLSDIQIKLREDRSTNFLPNWVTCKVKEGIQSSWILQKLTLLYRFLSFWVLHNFEPSPETSDSANHRS